MKLVLFNDGRPGLLREDGVVDITDAVPSLRGQETMKGLIANFAGLRNRLVHMEGEGTSQALSQLSLLPPLPKPNKLLSMSGNYREFSARNPSPMRGFFKSSAALISPEDTVMLQPDEVNIFHHEAELVLVFGDSSKDVGRVSAMDCVFRYTCGVDVSARLPANQRGGRNTTSMPISPWKSFDTFGPIGSVHRHQRRDS